MFVAENAIDLYLCIHEGEKMLIASGNKRYVTKFDNLHSAIITVELFSRNSFLVLL